MTEERFNLLLQALARTRQLLILTHNDPDPDAIGSAVALQWLLSAKAGIQCRIAYKGIIGRAENKALVRYLGDPVHRLTDDDLRTPVDIALIDTQPCAGNNPLPAELTAAVVIDHHPRQRETARVLFADVRSRIGATSTILTEYIEAANLQPDPKIATALFYGIKTDTQGLIRGASAADIAAYSYVQPFIDVDALMEIEGAQVPTEYFRRLDATLHAARVYDGVVLSYIGPMSYPDLAAAMADLLLRLQGMRWAITMGTYGGDLIVAARSRSRRGRAGELARMMVGDQGTAGGHGMMASGHIPLQGRDPEQLAQQLGEIARRHLGVPAELAGKQLV
jgi:nanoRNase/pAp phosphatase (c-di-AMP/oligoRNAs hydrolase)